MNASERSKASATICDQLLRLPEVAAARTIHSFWPSARQVEVDLRPLLRARMAEGCRVVLPVVESMKPPAGGGMRMSHRLLSDERELVLSRFGLFEPLGQPEVDLDEIDVLLVPASGADRRGTRLGHGGGFYDELLARLDARRICVAFAACLVPLLPSEPHDIPVNVVATETETLRFS